MGVAVMGVTVGPHVRGPTVSGLRDADDAERRGVRAHAERRHEDQGAGRAGYWSMTSFQRFSHSSW